MKILVVIDVQNDFITGALRNEEAIKRVPNIIEEINKGWDYIFLTRDTHQENYMETMEGHKLPVPHCIQGTDGWQFHNDVLKAIKGKDYSVINKRTFGYNDWGGSFNYLHFRNYEFEEDDLDIEVVGYCTDICVISNVMILKANFPEARISVKENCCAGVTEASHKNALEAMKMCHINII